MVVAAWWAIAAPTATRSDPFDAGAVPQPLGLTSRPARQSSLLRFGRLEICLGDPKQSRSSFGDYHAEPAP
jgi:hypothetical protein